MRKPILDALFDSYQIEFDSLISLTKNLLVDNKNFTSGYYVKTYLRTSDFVRSVVIEQGEYLCSEITRVQDLLVEEFKMSDLPLPFELGNEFFFVTNDMR